MKAILVLLAAAAACPAAAAGVDARSNLAYYEGAGADPVHHRLDLYLPAGQKNFPVLVFVYGGDWATGSKDLPIYASLARRFASEGIATAVINYRLSPKVKHPAHVQDVARAIAWVHAHIVEYGGRADRIFLCGHSAGGHLVSLVVTDPSYLRAVGMSATDIRGVIPISGVYTIAPGFRLYRPAFGTDPEIARAASPINHVSGQLPPFLILYGDRDVRPMREDARRMTDALEKNGTTVESREIRSHGHIQMVMHIGTPGDPVGDAIAWFVARLR
jgi:acetyl esterase/lipase